MSDKSFIRDNAVLLLGILLPVLLVAFIGISNEMAKTTVADPEYAVIFSKSNHYNTGFDVDVNDGKLSLHYKQGSNENYRPPISFYIYDYASDTYKEYEYKAPQTAKDETQEVQLSSELTRLNILEGSISPDGYQFDTHYRRSSPFSIFGGSRGRAVLTKDTRRIKIPQGDRYYYNMHAVGWVKSSELGDIR